MRKTRPHDPAGGGTYVLTQPGRLGVRAFGLASAQLTDRLAVAFQPGTDRLGDLASGGRARGKVARPRELVERDPGVAGPRRGGHALSLVVGWKHWAVRGLQILQSGRLMPEAAQNRRRRGVRFEPERPVGALLGDEVPAAL